MSFGFLKKRGQTRQPSTGKILSDLRARVNKPYGYVRLIKRVNPSGRPALGTQKALKINYFKGLSIVRRFAQDFRMGRKK